MRLIDADKLIKEMKDECNGRCALCAHYTFLSDDVHCGLIDAQPTVDAVPVVKGEWERNGNSHQYFCSVCGGKESAPRKFCPSCGAKMTDDYSAKHLEAVRDMMKKTGLTNEEMEGYFFGKEKNER